MSTVPVQKYSELKEAMEALQLTYAIKMKELGAMEDKFQAQETALKAAEDAVAAKAVSPVTVVPTRERKLRKFGEKSDNFLTWEVDARGAIAGPGMTDAEQADFLYNKLQGPARREIKSRGEDFRTGPEVVLEALKKVFASRGEADKVTKEFWARDQIYLADGRLEEITAYSHALMEILERLALVDPDMGSQDALLKKKFKSGVADNSLRWQLRSFLDAKPNCSFLELREVALAYEEESGAVEVAVPKKARSSAAVAEEVVAEVSEVKASGSLQAAMDKMMKQVSSLQQQVTEQQRYLSTILSQQSQYQMPVQPQYQVPNTPGAGQCFNCGSFDHYIKDCGAPRKKKGF